jgi:SAM-dependent methyltransferase
MLSLLPRVPSPDPALLASIREELLTLASARAPASLAAWTAIGPADAAAPPGAAARLFPDRHTLAAWLRAVARPGDGSGAWETDPAGHLAGRALAALQAVNQFLPLEGRLDTLRDLTSEALADAAATLDDARDPEALRAGLSAAAAAWAGGAARLAAALAAEARGAGLRAAPVVCASYDPELQLRVLGLEAASLAEPILDLGCGREARLVRHLRALGKDARGVDRVAEPGEGVSRGDWLVWPVSPSSLGTLVSHLGFSLHFLHHHLRADGDPARHARRYMELLRALRPGGTFAYAPGLPFVETHLPADAWRVERSAVPVPQGAAAGPGWYASRVTRR